MDNLIHTFPVILSSLISTKKILHGFTGIKSLVLGVCGSFPCSLWTRVFGVYIILRVDTKVVELSEGLDDEADMGLHFWIG